jgi:hypothetical protein
MKARTKFIVVLLLLLFLNIAVVNAAEDNSTDSLQLNETDSIELEQASQGDVLGNDTSSQEGNVSDANESSAIEKTTPVISIESSKVKSKDSLQISLKNSSGNALKSKKLTVKLNNKKYSLKTDSKGIATLPINLAKGKYTLSVSFGGDDKYNPSSKNFKIKVSKLNTRIVESANFAVRGKYLYLHLVDSSGNSVSSKKLTIKFNGKKYSKKTNSKGRVKLKVKSSNRIKVNFKADKQYKSSHLKLFIHSTTSRMIKIGNSKLLSHGYLRVYLKIAGKPVSKKVTLFVGSKKLTKKSNSEGIAVFKPSVKPKAYKVKAKVGKYYSSKSMKCYEGNVKDPMKEAIQYKNGQPDIDVMPGNYVMGDDSATYTLTKAQYKDVLKRDSYCLFLNNKLTKYTFFKTKNHPKLNHIIKRDKWNVIERAINAKLVKKNKNGYWPGKIKVSLKGKSCKYPEVRISQSTGVTCGPSSASMCSQVLKNFMNERHIAKLAKTNREGTKCSNMIKALAKHNMLATYFYKSTFNDALKDVKNGGCALIFHAYRHYVAILDVSSNGKKVLVSNSYGSYDNIPSKWVKVSYMKKKFSPQWSESLKVKLNYKLSDSTKNSINSYYASMGKNWVAQNTHHTFGRV